MRPLCIPDTCNMTGPARVPAQYQVRRREKHKFRFLWFFRFYWYFLYTFQLSAASTLTSLSVLSLMQSLCNFICFHTLEIPNFMVAEKSLLCLFLPSKSRQRLNTKISSQFFPCSTHSVDPNFQTHLLKICQFAMLCFEFWQQHGMMINSEICEKFLATWYLEKTTMIADFEIMIMIMSLGKDHVSW